MKLSASNIDFSRPSLSPNPLSWSRLAHPPPGWDWDLSYNCFQRGAWKQLQIRIDMLLIITSTGDELFGGIYLDDLKRPWTPKIKGVAGCIFCDFRLQCTLQGKLRRNDWRQTKTSREQELLRLSLLSWALLKLPVYCCFAVISLLHSLQGVFIGLIFLTL